MIFFHHIYLFIKNNGKQLQRKWATLPLLFLFPIVLVGLTAYSIVTFFTPEDHSVIQVGLVDKDQSKETKMVVKLLEESSQLSNFIEINVMTDEKAEKKLENNDLSAYIIFPTRFTSDLYNGNSVTVNIVGNPNKPLDSYLVKELIESVSRHIKSAQANILTMNYYAKKLPMDDETRNDFLYKQFTDFVFYTLGKDKILDEETLTNHVSNSTYKYYGLAGIFIVLSVWLLSFYSILSKEESNRMMSRMRLYNVTHSQQIIAKIIISIVGSMVLILIPLLCFFTYFETELYASDYVKIGLLFLIYSFIFLIGIAIIEVMIRAARLRLLIHSFYIGVCLLMSGSIVPSLYFPYYFQDVLPYVFSHQTLYWLQEMIVNNRVYVDYIPLLSFGVIGVFIFGGISLWKERVSR